MFLSLAVGGSSSLASRLHLPRDHYGHPRAGIEWWYFTGVVQGDDGHRYSIFYTLFSRAGYVLPISQVIDLDTGTIVGHSETVTKENVGTANLDVYIDGGTSLRWRRRTNTWFASVAQPYGLSFTAHPQKRYVLHGGGSGIIRQAASGTSAYYSATRMSAEGTITTGTSSVSFNGTAWFDHQWGNFANDPSPFNWDWFSCRFDDRTELMLYSFRAAGRTGTYVLRNGRSRLEQAFELTPSGRVLDAEGHTWPLGWELRVPSLGLDENLSAVVDDQLFRGALVPTFYEGAMTAAGTKTGICFVEETYS